MPARRIGGDKLHVRKFDVVGQDSAGTSEFIRHVGLANEEKDSLGSLPVVPMVRMGPPLSQGAASGAISAIGAAGLTVDEALQIQVFVDEQVLEYEAAKAGRREQYVIAPHMKEEKSRDGTIICRRYNCAGFVIEAYRSAGVDFIQTAQESLPPVAQSTLEIQYPDMVRLLENLKNRENFGIPGDGPWPVVLAGYVLNALDRDENEIRSVPYIASAGDEFFPSRRLKP
jgi:hypothetical protein